MFERLELASSVLPLGLRVHIQKIWVVKGDGLQVCADLDMAYCLVSVQSVNQAAAAAAAAASR